MDNPKTFPTVNEVLEKGLASKLIVKPSVDDQNYQLFCNTDPQVVICNEQLKPIIFNDKLSANTYLKSVELTTISEKATLPKSGIGFALNSTKSLIALTHSGLGYIDSEEGSFSNLSPIKNSILEGLFNNLRLISREILSLTKDTKMCSTTNDISIYSFDGMVMIDSEHISYVSVKNMYKGGNGGGLQYDDHLEHKAESIAKLCDDAAKETFQSLSLLSES
ncbi:hypothetical protein DZF79_14135 [Vibrio parahaemolyticus]|nr:hypothetical protein [Vibrio parahaemolyticus]